VSIGGYVCEEIPECLYTTRGRAQSDHEKIPIRAGLQGRHFQRVLIKGFTHVIVHSPFRVYAIILVLVPF